MMFIIEDGYQGLKNYKESIIHSNRFFVEEKYKKCFECYIHANTREVLRDSNFYRARINKFNQEEPYDEENIRMPKRHIVSSNGRGNPTGINYFYVAENLNTACAEVRPSLEDKITVGEFKSKKNLKIVELAYFLSVSNGDVYDIYEIEDGDENDRIAEGVMKFMMSFILDFSKLIKENHDYKYAPYQYFAELCKLKGLDGIKFRSSLMEKQENNMNYIFFKDDDFDLESTSIVVTNRIDYEFASQ